MGMGWAVALRKPEIIQPLRLETGRLHANAWEPGSVVTPGLWNGHGALFLATTPVQANARPGGGGATF